MPVSPLSSGSIPLGNRDSSSGDPRQDRLLRFLGHHFESLSQTLTRFFHRWFHLDLSIELLGVEGGAAQDLVQRRRPSYLFCCPTEDQKCLFFLGLDPTLAGIVLDRLEGGGEDVPADPVARPTLFDQTLLSAFCERLAPLISVYLGDSLSLTKPYFIESDTVSASVEPYFILTWSISVRGEPSFLELYLPASRVEELSRDEDFQPETPPLRILAGRIRRETLPRDLTVGTVIPTGLKPDALFHAVLGKNLLFKVRIGEYHGEEAVEIVEDISKT